VFYSIFQDNVHVNVKKITLTRKYHATKTHNERI